MYNKISITEFNNRILKIKNYISNYNMKFRQII